jgi:DNA-binding CsgD family transcriptional regulator
VSDVEPIRIAFEVGDAALAHRLALLLAAVPGLELVPAGAAAEVRLVADPEASADTALTPRELEVLTLVAEGASNKLIARRLGISVHTAKFHVGQLLDKLDATGRTDAVTHAARLGILHL